MKINKNEQVSMDAKTLKLHCKIRDCFTAGLYSSDGKEIKDYDGYVPDFMPGNHYGDYLILDIDIETGQITNWKQPTAEQLEEWINED